MACETGPADRGGALPAIVAMQLARQSAQPPEPALASKP